MDTNRVLVIEKLLVAIPNEMTGSGENGAVTIDDALKYLLKYRKTSDAVLENMNTNFVFCASDFPNGVQPDIPSQFTKEMLLDYLLKNSNKKAVGLMAMTEYDKDLQKYRNTYTEKETTEFLYRKDEYLGRFDAENQDPPRTKYRKNENYDCPVDDDPESGQCHCDGCDLICDECCPYEKGVDR